VKKLSASETRLLTLTGMVFVLAVSIVFVRRQLDAHRSRSSRREAAQTQYNLQEEALAMRPDLLVELQRIRGQLPRHPVGKDLNSGFLREIQALAGASGLTLTDRTPEDEEYLETLDIYTTSVRCGWRGNDDALVKFLVRLQQRGPVMDVHTLRIKARSESKKEMNGSFTLEFVYSREESVGLEPEETREIAL